MEDEGPEHARWVASLDERACVDACRDAKVALSRLETATVHLFGGKEGRSFVTSVARRALEAACDDVFSRAGNG